jgi:uncharacterized protein (TIGR02118 family)
MSAFRAKTDITFCSANVRFRPTPKVEPRQWRVKQVCKMARMIVIYKMPKDVDAFERHYFEKHVPLAKKLPGLRKYEVSHGPITSPAGPTDAWMIATLYFDDIWLPSGMPSQQKSVRSVPRIGVNWRPAPGDLQLERYNASWPAGRQHRAHRHMAGGPPAASLSAITLSRSWRRCPTASLRRNWRSAVTNRQSRSIASAI